jgi:hypothetical protein
VSVDGLETNRRFIEFMKEEKIINEKTCKELMIMAQEETAKPREVGEKMIAEMKTKPLKSSSNADITTKSLGIPFFRGERIEYQKLDDVPKTLLIKIHELDNNNYEKVAKHYPKYISKNPSTFDTKPRQLPNGYFLRTKKDAGRMWKFCGDIVIYAGFMASDWKVEY